MEEKLEWALSDLFEDDNGFYLSVENIYKEFEKNIDFKDSSIDSEVLLELLNFKWSIKEKVNNILIYGSLRYYKDVESDETKKMKAIAEQLVSTIDVSLAFIDEKIVLLGEERIRTFIESNENLKKYELYLDNIFRLRSHIQNEECNVQISNLKNEISSILAQYNTTSREIDLGTIIVDGKEVKLTPLNVAKFLSSRDRATREQAYLSVNNAYKEKEDIFAKQLNDIYIRRVKISELEGYTSVGEKALFDENIDTIILDNLITSVQKNIGLIREYLKLKTGALSINDPHLYDYGVPFDNNNRKKYTIDDAVDIVKNALKPLGEEYSKVIDILLSNNHIDANIDLRKHQSITFSWSTYSFMNYREAYIDLKNFVHEIGHIVNAYLSKNRQPFIYEDSSVFVGETASLVNEVLLNRYLYQNAEDDDERLFYLSTNIENYFTQVYRQTMYTEFENILYQHTRNGTELSSSILEKEYLNLLKEYYGIETIYDDCSNVEWARLGHLYRWNYYVYKYATGLIMASAIVNYIVDEGTLPIEKYIEFLSAGSNDYSLNLLAKLGIDLTDEVIINNSFNVLEKDIKEFSKILTRQ